MNVDGAVTEEGAKATQSGDVKIDVTAGHRQLQCNLRVLIKHLRSLKWAGGDVAVLAC